MSTMAGTLQPLRADDGAVVDGWLALLARSADDPRLPPPCPVDMVGSLRHAPPDTELDDWVLARDGAVVGSLRLALPAGDGPARVDQLLVSPAARRHGIGTALYRHALARAAAHGRDGVVTTIVEPLPGDAPRDPAPVAFATAVGAERLPGGHGLHQILDLAADDPLADGVPPAPDGYALVEWGTITPDEHSLAVSALELSLGGRSTADADVSIAASYARRFEKMRVGRGRRAHHTGAVHTATGELVGYTSISKTTGNPEHALQGMTVVRADHRGHGLGRVLKLANLALALRAETELRVLETTNDETNAAMVAVNAAMGYRPVDRWVRWAGSRLP